MPSDPGTVRRYSRATRWFHALSYLTVLVLLGTGWWLVAGREGQPSVAARLTGVADTSLHRYAGWALTALVASAVTLGIRATRRFVHESLRYDHGDLKWFARWPGALVTGRFARHEGHFDPGQRVANLLMVGLFVALIGSGLGLVWVTGGPWFVWLQRLHRWATYLITPILIGHVVIASGLPPGYRGVARAMHLGGRLPQRVAERVWPGWLDRQRGVPMTAEPPCPFTISVASLLIGALGPLERQELEAHLRQCSMCREELILLAPLPGLLHRAAPPRLRFRRSAGRCRTQ